MTNSFGIIYCIYWHTLQWLHSSRIRVSACIKLVQKRPLLKRVLLQSSKCGVRTRTLCGFARPAHWSRYCRRSRSTYSNTSVNELGVWITSCSVTMFACFSCRSSATAARAAQRERLGDDVRLGRVDKLRSSSTEGIVGSVTGTTRHSKKSNGLRRTLRGRSARLVEFKNSNELLRSFNLKISKQNVYPRGSIIEIVSVVAFVGEPALINRERRKQASTTWTWRRIFRGLSRTHVQSRDSRQEIS